MNGLQTRVLDALIRAQRFLDANNAALGTVNSSGARKTLDAAITALSGHGVDQGSHKIGGVGETQNQAALRKGMRDTSLRPIAKVARAKLADSPQISDLRLPKASVWGLALVTAASAMADAAAPYASVFTDAGLTPNFLDTLRASIAQLQGSLDVRTDHTRSRKGATNGLQTELANARHALQMLDGVIAQQVPGNSQLFADWQSERRVQSKPGASKRAGTAPVAASGTTTATVATPTTVSTTAVSTTAVSPIPTAAVSTPPGVVLPAGATAPAEKTA